MHVFAALLEPRGSELAATKPMLNAEKFVWRLSCSNSSHFSAIHSCHTLVAD